jgi:hypothetical protein
MVQLSIFKIVNNKVLKLCLDDLKRKEKTEKICLKM